MIVKILTLLTGAIVATYAILWNNIIPMVAFIMFGFILWFYCLLNLEENKAVA